MNFRFMRLAKVAQVGTCSIVVNNPTDREEVEAKLRSLEFARFLPLDEEYDDYSWQFAEEEDDEPDDGEYVDFEEVANDV